MKKVAIKKVGIMSLANLVGTWYAVLGFVTSIFAAVYSVVWVLDSTDSVLVEIFGGVGVVLGSLILIPLLSYMIGWLYGAFIALILNLVVSAAGGLVIETEDVK